MIRKLILLGYTEFNKNKAAKEYLGGNITLSEAAHRADLSLWDMEQYLIQKGFRSSYGIEDLKEEIKLLQTMR